MDTKLYLTIAAIVAILYGIGFVLIPAEFGRALWRAAGAARRPGRPGLGVGAPRVWRDSVVCEGLPGLGRSTRRPDR